MDLSEESIAERIRRRRKYAGFFDWPDRRVKERAVVQRLSEALQAAGEPGFIGVASEDMDPPDCVAVTPDGHRIAVEVTELVDQEMATAGQRVSGQHRDWSALETISRLQKIVDDKDLKSSGLSSYSTVLLVIHTDEMLLQGYAGDDVWTSVRAHRFRKPRFIHEVILLVSYDPRLQAYPFVRLTLEAGS